MTRIIDASSRTPSSHGVAGASATRGLAPTTMAWTRIHAVDRCNHRVFVITDA